MNLNQEQLRALAESCHIGLTGKECEALVGELNELLALADRLPVAEGVCDPEATAVSPEQLRADTAMPCLSREAALSNSGRTCEGCFAVPRTVESVS